MTVDELVRKLGRVFPQGFGGKEGLNEWQEILRGSLKQFEGPTLDAAYSQLMGAWDRPFPPMPGAWQVACINARKEITGRGGTGLNWKEINDQMMRLKPILIDDWLQGNADLVARFLARFNDDDPAPTRFAAGEPLRLVPLNDRQLARARLVDLLRDRAHLAAMCQAMGKTAQVDIFEFDREDPETKQILRSDLDRIEGQVRSQRRYGGFGNLGKTVQRPLAKPLRDGPEPAREMTDEDWSAHENEAKEMQS
jgi:hypothetical protein